MSRPAREHELLSEKDEEKEVLNALTDEQIEDKVSLILPS